MSNKSIQNTVLFALLSLLAVNSTLAASGDRNIAIEVLIDDSATLTQPEDAAGTRLQLLSHLQDLRKKIEYRNARINFTSTSLARSVWVGKPNDLRKPERAQKLLEELETKPTHCNNLPGAFRTLTSNVEQATRQGVDEIHVIVFSSLIHTPLPCGEDITINLPQIPPPDLKINELLTGNEKIHSAVFYWVNPYQKRLWEELLLPSIEHLTNTGKHSAMYDMENTVYELEQGIGGIEQ